MKATHSPAVRLLALGCLFSAVACAAPASSSPAPKAPATAATPTHPTADPFAEPPLRETSEDDDIVILDDDPTAIAEAKALLDRLDALGNVENAYAPTLECFNGRTDVAFDDILDEYAQPITQDFALGWDVIASIVPLESSPDEATFVVRGSAMIEGDIVSMLDERIVVVRRFDDGWRIAAEANRNAPGCMSERWASIDDDHRFSTCDELHRECLVEIDPRAACGGMGCACNSCVMQYESCNEKAAACLLGEDFGV